MLRERFPKLSSHTLISWIGVLILLWGAILRLSAFDETLILGDQSAILDAAFQAAHLRYFPFIGMKSSAGVMQTGIVPLLAAASLFFVRRILAVQWFFSVLDVLALAWLFRAVRKNIGHHAAWVTGLLYATAPWVILYVRTIWYQTLIATFATVAFSSILYLLRDSPKSPWVLVLAMTSTTLMSMVHLAAAPWGFLLFVLYAAVARKECLWKSFCLGMGISVMLVLPYVVYLVNSSFADIAFIFQTGVGSARFSTTSFRLSRELLAGGLVVGNAHGDLWDRSVMMWKSADTMVLVMIGLSLVWAGYHIFSNRRMRLSLSFIVVWLVGVPALFVRSSIHLQHFYLMMLFPAPFVLVAAWLENCLSLPDHSFAAKLYKVLGTVSAALLVLVALWWSSLWLVRIRLEARGLLERPTRGWLLDRTAQIIHEYLEEQPDGEVIILTEFEGEMSAFEWLRGNLQTDAVRVISPSQGFLLPEGPLCYLLGPGATEKDLHPVWAILDEQPGMAVPASPSWRFYCGMAPLVDYHQLATWENGLVLVKTEVTSQIQPGELLHITHTWVYRGKEQGAYHFYNHLLKDGELIAQVDGRGIPYWYWRNGDTLLTYFTLQLPPELPEGDYILRTGLYTWPGLVRVTTVTGDDGYAGLTFAVP
jgi:hypothetical protein